MRRHLLALCLLAPLPAAAEPLAEFHWAGSDAAAEAGYAGSRTEQLVDLMEPERLADAADRVRAALLERNPDPDLAEGLALLDRFWSVSWRSPVTAWFSAELAPSGGVRWGVTDPADRAQLLKALRDLLAEVEDPPGWSVLEEPEAVSVVYGNAPAPEAPPAAEALLRLDVKVAPIVGFLAQAAEADLPPAEAQKLRAVLRVLDPASFRRLSYTQRFDEEGLWQTEVVVDAERPRAGLAGLLIDTPAVEDADLQVVPADASLFTAFGLDLAGGFALAREALRAADPEADAQLAEALAQARDAAGVDLEADLLANLSPVHTLFQDPAAGGESFASLLFTNRLRDPDAFAAAADEALGFLNALVEAQTADMPLSGAAYTSEVGGVPVTTVPLPGVAPSFAVVDGVFVLGLYPQSIAAALDRRDTGGGTILQREDFADSLAEAREEHLDGVTSVSFVDLPELAPASYGSLLLVEHVGTGLASMAAREPVPPVLPPFGRVRPLLSPSYGFGAAGDGGWLAGSVAPFPGASLLGGGVGGGGGQVLLIVPGAVAGAFEELNANPHDDFSDDDFFFDDPVAPPAPPVAPPPAPGSVDPPPPPPF